MKKTACSPWLRILALCLVCVAVLGVFAGCAKKTAPETSDTLGSTTSQDNETASNPKVETEPATPEPGTTDPADEETLPPPETDPSIDYDGLNTQTSYTVDSLSADDERLTAVVAECGDWSLTNRELQMLYYMQFNYYYNMIQQYVYYYGYPMEYFGLDVTKPLSEQECTEVGGLTWEQYFLMLALESFHETSAMEAEGKAAGFTLSEEDLAELQELKDSLPEQAEQYGFESAEALLQASFGENVTVEDYSNFVDRYKFVDAYDNSLYDAITWNDDDLREFYENNPETYAGIPDLPNVNVRHILITPEDADGDQATSDGEKAAAKAKAEALLEEFLKDPSEQNFAALANEHSTDPGSNEKGGLYEDVYPGQMVQTFNDWCFDPDRKTGDTGIVETSYGYHIMYFVSQTQTYYWKSLCEEDYPNYRMGIIIDEAKEHYPMTVDYAAIVIGPLPESVQESED